MLLFSVILKRRLVVLLAAAVLAGCSSESWNWNWGREGKTDTPANKPVTKAKPPAAPTGLHEWVDESKDPVPAHFAWTPPSGPISGYYFWIKGVYVGITPPPAICGPSWDKLPATSSTYTIDEVQAQPDAYICAFNAAGTSPTVQFPRDTPLVSTPTKA